MAGKTKYPPAVRARVRDLATAGASVSQIRDAIASEYGSRPSAGWINIVRHETPPASAPPPPAVTAVAAAVADAPAPRDPLPPSSDDEILGSLRTAFAEASDLAAAARAAGDVARAASWTRVMRDTSAELRQRTKGDDDDPDDAPGVAGATVRAAAASARQRMLTALARVQDDRAAWPRCPTCGAPVDPSVS